MPRHLTSIVAAAVLLLAAVPASAAELVGRWSGGGALQLPSGATEKARCNISYSRSGGSSYTAFANCATQSARVSQSAKLRRIGGNEYEGSFYNAEYNVTGTFSVSVKGSSQMVQMSGGGASASFKLSRR